MRSVAPSIEIKLRKTWTKKIEFSHVSNDPCLKKKRKPFNSLVDLQLTIVAFLLKCKYDAQLIESNFVHFCTQDTKQTRDNFLCYGVKCKALMSTIILHLIYVQLLGGDSHFIALSLQDHIALFAHLRRHSCVLRNITEGFQNAVNWCASLGFKPSTQGGGGGGGGVGLVDRACNFWSGNCGFDPYCLGRCQYNLNGWNISHGLPCLCVAACKIVRRQS